jgi:hypothetical protein
MKQSSRFFEMSSVAMVLLIAMLIAMWARRPDASCTASSEPPRHLVLSRDTDREHLATDLSTADKTARRYMLSAGAADQSEQRIRFAECAATLVRQIATTHGLPPDLVRARLTDSQ